MDNLRQGLKFCRQRVCFWKRFVYWLVALTLIGASSQTDKGISEYLSHSLREVNCSQIQKGRNATEEEE